MKPKNDPRPTWLTSSIPYLTKTGILNLKNNIQLNFNDFSSNYFLKKIPLIKILDISYTEVKSLIGLPYLPNLKSFNADYTEISSFVNFKSIQHATQVSFKQTTISFVLNYKLSLLLIFGKKLVSIDGKKIPMSLFDRLSTYPKYCSELVNRGWIAESPCPDENRLKVLCNDYGLTNYIDNEATSSRNDIIDTELDFDKIRNEYKNIQKTMFKAAELFFQMTKPRNLENDLAIAILQLFNDHGIFLKETSDKDGIVEAVDNICKKAATIRDFHMILQREKEEEKESHGNDPSDFVNAFITPTSNTFYNI